MRPSECGQTDRHAHTETKRIYNLSHAMCYSYGTDNDWVVVWPSGNGVGHINEVALRRARLELRWVTVRLIPSWYVTNHSGQLRLLPSAGREMSAGQETATVLCMWEGNRRSGIAPAVRYRFCGVYTPAVSVA